MSSVLLSAVQLMLTGCAVYPWPVGPTRTVTSEPIERRPPRLLAAALHDRTGAHLAVGSAAARITVRAVDLPGLLYQVSTPGDSGLAPRVTGTDKTVRLRFAPTGDVGPDTVDILLNRRVRWHIRLLAGAGEQRLDLAAGRLSGVELGAGAGLIRMRLPPPRGSVPIRLSGGVGAAEIRTPAGTPVRLRLVRGAGRLRVPWGGGSDGAPGAVLTSPGWSRATDRYTLDARAVIGSLDVGN